MLLISPRDLEKHPLLKGLGLEPTGNELSAEALAPRFKGRAAPLKAVALRPAGDRRARQHLCLRGAVAGRALAASRGRHSGPRRRQTDRHGSSGWSRRCRAVIADAIEAGGSSLRDYVQANGELGLFQHRFAVYDREGRAVPEERRRHHPPHRSVRALDFLLSRLPALEHDPKVGTGFRKDHAPIKGEPASSGRRTVMAYENILVERRGGAGLITLNSPKTLNALSKGLVADVNHALAEFEADDEDRRRRHHRLGEGVLRRRQYPRGCGHRLRHRLCRRSRARNGTASPNAASRSIAAVAGYALGGGCELAMMCDVILAADTAQVRTAGDHARHHPRRRRHAAPGTADRQGEGDGALPDRPADRRGRGGADGARLAHRRLRPSLSRRR